jgi:hypothetical protein
MEFDEKDVFPASEGENKIVQTSYYFQNQTTLNKTFAKQMKEQGIELRELKDGIKSKVCFYLIVNSGRFETVSMNSDLFTSLKGMNKGKFKILCICRKISFLN